MLLLLLLMMMMMMMRLQPAGKTALSFSAVSHRSRVVSAPITNSMMDWLSPTQPYLHITMSITNMVIIIIIIIK